MSRTLRFACQPGCTACCEEPGYVYLTEEDLRRAAAHLGMTRDGFERRFVYRTTHLLRLRKPCGRQCPFLLSGGCSIHDVKPTQCRLFPFWPELLANDRAWHRGARSCIGIGKGRVIQIGTAHETAAEMARAYPAMYDALESIK